MSRETSGKREHQKIKPYIVLEYLMKNSDEQHAYAVISIKNGDDIKTIQGNLGHATAAFTLDIYGHVTDEMKQASSNRMEKYIKSVTEI